MCAEVHLWQRALESSDVRRIGSTKQARPHALYDVLPDSQVWVPPLSQGDPGYIYLCDVLRSFYELGEADSNGCFSVDATAAA